MVAGLVALPAGPRGVLPSVAGLFVGGLIGFADDRSKLTVGNRGIPARLKFPSEVVLAIRVAFLALHFGGMHQLFIPWSVPFWILLPLAVFAIVGTANAVNLTDGMDGLAAGLSVIAIGALVLWFPLAESGEKAVAISLCGGLVGVLVYNRYPARIFMGDTGAL